MFQLLQGCRTSDRLTGDQRGITTAKCLGSDDNHDVVLLIPEMENWRNGNWR